MKSYALKLNPGTSVRAVELALGKFLPGLDVRLFQYSPAQAIVPGHLVHALNLTYSNLDEVGKLLRHLGVTSRVAMTDEQVQAILSARDSDDLETRAKRLVPVGANYDEHLVLCRVPAAWAVLNGPDSINWDGVRVGQIDTGYTTHPALGFPNSWVLTNLAATFEPDVSPSEINWPPPPNPGPGLDPINDNGGNAGHGTKIGSTIAGYAPEVNFFGVAPKVPLVPVRISNSVVINHRQPQFVQAIDHLVNVAKVQVINVSLGLFPDTSISKFKRAINDAYNNGVIVVCAAGNYVSQVVAPASLHRTLCIGGTTLDGRPWSGSSYGTTVDVSAPAADLRRAETSYPNRYRYKSGGDGTSYATAMVSGAAALWLVHHRTALTARYPKPWQVVEAFKEVLRTSIQIPNGITWQLGSFGYGILDVYALLNAPLPDPTRLNEDPPN